MPQRNQTVHRQENINIQVNIEETLNFLNQTPSLPEHFQNKVNVQNRPPPSIKAKPRVAPRPAMYPTATVLYTYAAQDHDEISLSENAIVEVTKVYSQTASKSFHKCIFRQEINLSSFYQIMLSKHSSPLRGWSTQNLPKT